MATVYIETSIVSYLRQRPSSQVVMAARQLLTHQWWEKERSKNGVPMGETNGHGRKRLPVVAAK